MFSSKINELRESSFRAKNQNKPRTNLKERIGTAQSNLNGNTNDSVLQEIRILDRKKLGQYMLKLPICIYHHQPIKYICMSSNCSNNNFAICQQDECRKLHQNPDADIIDIQSLNQSIRTNCSSLLMLGENVSQYFKKTKEHILHELDVGIQKIQYLLDHVYMNQVPKLIRQQRHSELTSSKIFNFINKEIHQNNPQQKIKMENLRNQVATRITDMDKNLKKLYSGKEYNILLLNDVIKVDNSMSTVDYISKIQIKHFESTIMQFKEEFQVICKMLKQNRAPAFKKITTIFRASQHLFSSEKYHNIIDGKSPTITLIKTSNNKKFGAFLNCKINQVQDWICDATGLSFIFSLDREQVYKLKSDAGSRIKTAFGGREGPQIGSGCDIYLYDECNKYRKNGANLGGSYKLPYHLQFGSTKAKSYLAGEEYYLVDEYQVFLLQ